MITRRQLLFHGIGAGVLPIVNPRAPIEIFDSPKMRDVSAELGVHFTVLESVLDRFSELLPQTGVIIYGSRDRKDDCSFEVGDVARFQGHWRLDALDSSPAAGPSLAGTIGLGCPKLADRVGIGAALQYRAGLRMGGLSAFFYEGFETRICLLSSKYPDTAPPLALFIES